ncbi:5'-nucleotidase /3'-nucleotidase /exopolyphosphatase [Porphyromonadaceae bacterium KH3R12]|uniref:5'/3'-nucleotidase SurE n=1 Tax=Proteiniphilum TaxID=294702 RepID=UPI000896D965|nr:MULTISPECIES: 5'/3'-nucleotidase SurE [Proteiniphilum]MDY9920065.1 5'/3'-nucleotidase SurE [Proteiniphilum sp.]SDZ73005.1 5'-nucleotidase /3'-nucleotidase /exopolyphosphatase [Porphyromonadaceae bacterium KH3R12]
MMNRKPLILVTNDDGYQAKGIASLTEAVRDLGEVIVFAPDSHRSGMSSAISTSQPLRVRLHREEENLTVYTCNGTPVDCVKLALNEFVDRKPDLLVSGINHGSNAGISVIYSGTMGAAIEGCVFDVPSIGFSLCDFTPDADFSFTKEITRKLASIVIDEGLPRGICLNVNVPAGEVKGIRITTQTHGKWVNEYHRSKDGSGRDVFWMTGNFENWEEENDNSDEWALANGYAAVVPVKIDMTAYDFLPQLKEWSINGIY